MKKIFKLIAAMRSIVIIALVAVIGFSITACGGAGDGVDKGGGGGGGGAGGAGGGGAGGGTGSGGTFTLTDIPAKYNGKYANLNGGNSDVLVYGRRMRSANGAEDMGKSWTESKNCLISSGKVSIPMWRAYSDKYEGYTGNDKLTFYVFLEDAEDFLSNDLGSLLFSATFSNGSAAKSWNDTVLFTEK
jgi:hypothetical protein